MKRGGGLSSVDKIGLSEKAGFFIWVDKMKQERRLTTEQKIFIMAQLGVGEGLSKTAELFKDQFGLEIDRRHVAKYDPRRNPRMEKPMVEMFLRLQKHNLKVLAEIPCTHKGWRLRQLQEMLDAAEDAPIPNNVEIRAILEHAAKDVGDYWIKKK